MPRPLPLLALSVIVAGCAAGTSLGTPVAACSADDLAEARPADRVDAPAEPIGGLQAVQDRVRIPREGMRVASPTGRYAVVRAVVDTTGAVRCTEMVAAESGPKGDAARRAVHRSPFAPGRHAGTPVPVVLDLRLDVRGEGQRRVVTGGEIGG